MHEHVQNPAFYIWVKTWADISVNIWITFRTILCPEGILYSMRYSYVHLFLIIYLRLSWQYLSLLPTQHLGLITSPMDTVGVWRVWSDLRSLVTLSSVWVAGTGPCGERERMWVTHRPCTLQCNLSNLGLSWLVSRLSWLVSWFNEYYSNKVLRVQQNRTHLRDS